MSFDDPTIPPERPPVVMWFKIYSAVMALTYLICVLLGPVFFFVNPRDLDMQAVEAKIYGVVFIAIGLPFFILHVIPIFLKPKPWVWTFDLILICLGLSGCCLPFSVAMLIFWIKPETKAFFGREVNQ